MELKCKVQNYDWGKLGLGSAVAKLVSSADPTVKVEEDKPYAELWIGIHPSGPALIIERDVLLSDYIKDNLDAIGPIVRNKFGVTVPFLLKVLSIRKALSIQAHPNKEHAEILHKDFPDIYKDPNHKPELAIALTPFEALCGFRQISEIQEFFKRIPEFSEVLPQAIIDTILSHKGEGDSTKIVLKQAFESLITSSKVATTNGLKALMTRLDTEDEATQSFLLLPLLRRLHEDFPGDVGCFAPYFMNYLTLRPGQAIFLGPNVPHAYLSGDCVECMACSDNVVRAGLTPKPVDVGTLVAMLDYSGRAPAQLIFQPHLEDAYSCVWRPPVADFAVVKIVVPPGESYNTTLRPSPSLLLVTSGRGEARDTEPVAARPGVAIFLKASRQLTLTAAAETLEAYQAICNV